MISQIRASIFELRHDRHGPLGVESRLEQVINEHTPQLGYAPSLDVSGLGRLDMPDDLAADLVAVVREGLSNCARHAAALAVNVTVARVGNVISVEITDNGRGIAGDVTRSSGLSNLRKRARARGGDLHITTPAEGGTRLTWTAKLTA